MKKVKIVTDSTCYLPEEIIKKYDIRIAPLYVRFGDKVYAEHVDIQDEEYYERMGKGELADTTQPSTDDFIKIYESLLKKGYSIISPLKGIIKSDTVLTASTLPNISF